MARASLRFDPRRAPRAGLRVPSCSPRPESESWLHQEPRRSFRERATLWNRPRLPHGEVLVRDAELGDITDFGRRKIVNEATAIPGDSALFFAMGDPGDDLQERALAAPDGPSTAAKWLRGNIAEIAASNGFDSPSCVTDNVTSWSSSIWQRCQSRASYNAKEFRVCRLAARSCGRCFLMGRQFDGAGLSRRLKFSTEETEAPSTEVDGVPAEVISNSPGACKRRIPHGKIP